MKLTGSVIQSEGTEPGKPEPSSTKVRTEIEGILSELERTLNKRLLSLESRLKEFDDIRKYDKVLMKIQIDMNSKLNKDIYESDMSTKLGRNEFFDFVNKNLISRDQLKTLDHKIDRFVSDHSEKITVIDAYSRKTKRSLTKKIEELQEIIEATSKSVADSALKAQEREKLVDNIQQRMGQIERQMHDLRVRVVEEFSARLRSLATTKTINCLSCGKKDINYPPLTAYTKGQDDRQYISAGGDLGQADGVPDQDVKENNSKFQSQRIRVLENKENTETNLSNNAALKQAPPATLLQSGVKKTRLFSGFSGVRSRVESSKPTFGVFPKRQYSAAEQVVTRELVVQEHTDALHSLPPTNNPKARPLTSMPKSPYV